MKICPECGIDPYKVYDYDKMIKEQKEIGLRYKQALAAHGLARAEWEIKSIELTESMKFLQRKTRKQTDSLRRLEERIRLLGQQPYREEKTAATIEPGDFLLGDTVVVTKVEYFNGGQVIITSQVAPQGKEKKSEVGTA